MTAMQEVPVPVIGIQCKREREKRKGRQQETLHFTGGGGGTEKLSGFEDSQAAPAHPSGRCKFDRR
jgi:hypothetical protein